jgi:membrane-bound metal-dependent hydrolase YbcI (DUF457 family)
VYAGHLGVALAAKGLRQEEPLATLIVASIATDLVVAGLDVGGLDIPTGLSPHSIPGTLALGLALGAIVLAFTRSGRRAAFLGLVVLLHTLVDYVTSYLPTWPSGPQVGLFLYRFPIADMVIECAVIFAGWWVYRRGLAAKVRNSWATWAMLTVLLACQALFVDILAGA